MNQLRFQILVLFIFIFFVENEIQAASIFIAIVIFAAAMPIVKAINNLNK